MHNTGTRIRLTHVLTALLGLALPHAINVEAFAQAAPAAATSATAQRRPWLDRKLGIEERIKQLLQEMTLEEKIGQLGQANGVGSELTGPQETRARDSLSTRIRRGELGSILNEVNPESINSLQRVAVKESRLGIPLIFGRDVIHGFRTIFPIPLGQAASWNPQLVEKAAAIAAREARSVGVQWTFAPMVDIARDPRWGRIAESFGEDPYLG